MYNKYPNRIHNNKNLLRRRRYLRNNPTKEEVLLWEKLKGNNTGAKFRRQHSVGGYILDCYCPQKKLAIELDGQQHLENKDYDEAREFFFEGYGIKTIRFMNSEINNNIEKVISIIKSLLD